MRSVKKLINDPHDVVVESVEGFGLAHADIVAVSFDPDFVSRAGGAVAGKVGLVSGGGSGHEPLLAEVVITRSSSARSLDVGDLAAIAIEVFGEDRVHAVERLDDALDLAVQRAEGEEQFGAGVLVTGSITMVADVRILLGRG